MPRVRWESESAGAGFVLNKATNHTMIDVKTNPVTAAYQSDLECVPAPHHCVWMWCVVIVLLALTMPNRFSILDPHSTSSGGDV
jgi:hypothetical protein